MTRARRSGLNIRQRPGRLRRGLLAWTLVFCGLAVALAPPAADARTLIRDAEIERSLRELARPMIDLSGLNASRMNIIIVQDNVPNAFVANNSTIALHTGLLLRLKTPQQVQAVLAHEVAHIANGHLSRRMSNMKYAQRLAAIGLVLGGAAGLATGDTDAAVGVSSAMTGASLSAFLGHTRAEEAAADQSAIRTMARAGIDSSAMIEVLQLFRGQELLSPNRQEAYARSHPLTQDRIRAIEGFVAAYPGSDLTDPKADYWYARLQGKLSAFLRSSDWTLRRVPAADTSEIARMRRAVAYLRKPDPARAQAEVKALVAMRPNDPYYQELEGQILFESRRFEEAVVAYQRALELAPNQPLIMAAYGRALMAVGTRESEAKALEVLQKAHARDSRNPQLLRDLARAYSADGQNGMASAITAERYMMSGRLRDAVIHARRAVGILPNGSPGHRRAMDIIALNKNIASKN